MALLQTIVDCVEICYRHGITDVILCPGSRNAALIVAFEQHPQIRCYSISDERSAAFIAMGMAMTSGNMVVIVCTSGTAALNFSPAIAEAFFQEIPLLVLTADRPPEWINQYDGQTIFQTNIYGPHVKKTYQLLPDFEKPDVDWFAQRSFNEAILFGMRQPLGPVHLNIPIREPFYPDNQDVVKYSDNLRSITGVNVEPVFTLPDELFTILLEAKNILILVGQKSDRALRQILESFKNNPRVTVIGDCISNVHSDVTTQDFLFKKLAINFHPDVLITCGKSFISKNLKLYFRKNRVSIHLHVQETSTIYDPLQSVTHWINANPVAFFQSVLKDLQVTQTQQNAYKDTLLAEEKTGLQSLRLNVDNLPYSDIGLVAQLLPLLHENSLLHLGNSLSVRYVNAIQYLLSKSTTVYCNRGTSGIEGSLSTAVGQALQTTETVYCLLGDVSFQYDKNALWNNYLPPNLKIIILNNSGGNIFRMIPGPQSQAAYKTFFETDQRHSAKLIAEEFGLAYFSIQTETDFTKLPEYIAWSESPAILEVFTDPEINERAFKSLSQ